MLCRNPPMFGPDGADGCSHGWSSPKGNATRGTVTTRPSRPGGAEDGSPSLPPGRAREKRPISTGSASRCAGTRHPWLQPLTPSGSTAPYDGAQFEQAPKIGGFLHSTRVSCGRQTCISRAVRMDNHHLRAYSGYPATVPPRLLEPEANERLGASLFL